MVLRRPSGQTRAGCAIPPFAPAPASDPRRPSLTPPSPCASETFDQVLTGCTRQSFDDTRLGSEYEADYGRWIPGDAFEALRAVILVGLDGRDLTDVGRAALRACPSPGWS